MPRGIDLILLHPPSVYDFREKPIFWGPIADVVPSSTIFEMYPIGFSSISEVLSRHKIKTKIINLAYLMLASADFDVEQCIKSLNAKAFGIDLHWLCHAHGSIEIAKICKKYHPDIPVIFGGYSATFFYKEIMETYPQVDYIVRGDSTELRVLELMRCIIYDFPKDHIANLTWRQKNGKIYTTPLEQPAQKLDDYSNNYLNLFKIGLKNCDIKSQIPFLGWWGYPITAIMTVRGCTQHCAICGGSAYSMNRLCNRQKPSYRSAEKIINDVKKVSSYSKAPIFIIGDINQAGSDYANTILSGLKKLHIKNEIVFELFDSTSEEFFKRAAESIKNLNFEMSPETHDESMRKWGGKNYLNREMEQNIQRALDNGANKFDLYFMTGIPKQDYESVMKTIEYCETLMERFDSRLMPFISPLAPFIDPCSLVWDNPSKYGYTLFCKTLEDHRKNLLQPSWKYILSYETKWMSRDQIVESTYEAAKRLNMLKVKYGQIRKGVGQKIDTRIKKSVELIKKIDTILLNEKDEAQREVKLKNLHEDMKKYSYSTICEDDEIKWNSRKGSFHYIKILLSFILGRLN
ncbi:MAG: TIGR04190 family B12-binding domain/radical SAM domain protein [bacterium]